MNTENINNLTDRELLETIYRDTLSLKDELKTLKKTIYSIPQWISITDIANYREMSKESVRHRVVNSGDYELDKDYKYDGKRIVVNKNIIHTIKRQRKPKGSK